MLPSIYSTYFFFLKMLDRFAFLNGNFGLISKLLMCVFIHCNFHTSSETGVTIMIVEHSIRLYSILAVLGNSYINDRCSNSIVQVWNYLLIFEMVFLDSTCFWIICVARSSRFFFFYMSSDHRWPWASTISLSRMLHRYFSPFAKYPKPHSDIHSHEP